MRYITFLQIEYTEYSLACPVHTGIKSQFYMATGTRLQFPPDSWRMLVRRGSLLVASAAALATVALLLALVAQSHDSAHFELTFADGTVSDVPSLVDEADANLADGVAPLAGDHVGYWERPGNDNNMAYSDLAGAKMERRMRSDAGGAQFWETGGTDFYDTDSMYSPFTDGDDVYSSGWLGQFDNTWAGTGQGLYDYDDLEKQNDMYDGGFPIRQVEGEAADDAYVSGTDFIGYKAHPAELKQRRGAHHGARMTALWNAAANDEVQARNLGAQHRWEMNSKERAYYAPVQDRHHNRKYHPELPWHAEVTDATDMEFHPQQWLREQQGL
jgi:hypothetical protein